MTLQLEEEEQRGQTLSDAIDSSAAPTVYTVGTLKYTLAAIQILFFYLLWNDVVLILMEGTPRLTSFIWKDNGATLAQMQFWGSITAPFTIWINPVFSTWSDRCRTRWGRRRPFLLFAAPPTALFLALVPFMPDFGHWLMLQPAINHWAGGDSSKGNTSPVRNVFDG